MFLISMFRDSRKLLGVNLKKESQENSDTWLCSINIYILFSHVLTTHLYIFIYFQYLYVNITDLVENQLEFK